MKQQELVISLYSPLTADFYPFEEDALGFRETAADAVLLDGRDLADYADSVREIMPKPCILSVSMWKPS